MHCRDGCLNGLVRVIEEEDRIQVARFRGGRQAGTAWIFRSVQIFDFPPIKKKIKVWLGLVYQSANKIRMYVIVKGVFEPSEYVIVKGGRRVVVSITMSPLPMYVKGG